MDFCRQDVMLILAGAAVGILMGIFYLRYEELQVGVANSNTLNVISNRVENIEKKLEGISFTY